MWRIKHLNSRLLLVGLVLMSICLASCRISKASSYISVQEIPRLRTTDQQVANRCRDALAHAPDPKHLDHTPIKFVRVNVHFVNSADSTKNYTGARAQDFGPKLISEANKYLEQNQQMWLPHGNSTPVLPMRYRYVLTSSKGYETHNGIYCHYDDQLFPFVSRGRNRNNYSRDVIKRYGIGLDSIINLFVMVHHPDSILSETYKVTSAGIALGTGVKLSGIFETRKHPNAFRGLVNHEIGHVLGLRHTWNTNDGCDDTPRHTNCWNRTASAPCDTGASNNLMDYNANQHAWTPCQIGKIHMNFSRENSLQRKVLQSNWCQLDDRMNIEISDSVQWLAAKDLEGNLTIARGGVLEINCRVSIPRDGRISVLPGGTLILRGARLHNACGDIWKGISVSSQAGQSGRVVADQSTKIENIPNELLDRDQKESN